MYLSHGSIIIWYDGNMHHKLYIQKQSLNVIMMFNLHALKIP